jgi:hypothetical protein
MSMPIWATNIKEKEISYELWRWGNPKACR